MPEPTSFYDDIIWRKIDHYQEKELDWAKSFSIHSPAKSKKIISTLWVNTLSSLEEILRNLRSKMSISELCDKLLVTLYEHMQKTTKENSDYAILGALQTAINQPRFLQKVNTQKSEETLLHAIAIVTAVEDANRTAEELNLEPVELKQIDEHDGEPVYTF